MISDSILSFLSIVNTYLVPKVLNIVEVTAPIWAPVFLFFLFLYVWWYYLQLRATTKTDPVLLEIKIPREITKSPAAMEIIYTALYQTGAASYAERYLDGKIRPWFSLEMIGISGQVRFFIWTHARFKSIVEAQIYAQYPTVEVVEVKDYSLSTPHDPISHPFWGTQYKLLADDVFPIKTYVDYGLDKDPKEEFKIDPMSSAVEYLGSLKKGQMTWIQILIQAHTKKNWKEGYFTYGGEIEDWKEAAKKKIEEIREKAVVELEGEDRPQIAALTQGQKDQISSIERSINKMPFECLIRGIYFWDKNNFDASGITGLIGAFRQYNSINFNGFKLSWFTDLGDNAKDIFRFLPESWTRLFRDSYERRLLEAYKLRSFFRPPYKNFHGKPFILTTEELATIFHFPGQVVSTPGFERIPSKKSEPPPNLPI